MIEDNEHLKVALYTRVSTEDQAKEGYSLENQSDRLKSYCKTRQWDIVREYVDDGYSGRNTRRPAYKLMLEEYQSWEGILVIKMDRIHRNSKNFMDMIDFLVDKNKEFISATESLDTSNAMGRFVMDIIQRIAQLESEQIGERVRYGMEQKAKQGEDWVGHKFPYGYKWDRNKRKLKLIPEEIEKVKLIFKMFHEGNGIRAIGEVVGKHFTTVSYMLNNTMYCGYERYCEYLRRFNHGFEPIISVELFNKTQLELRNRCKHHSYKPLLIPSDLPDKFKLSKDQLKQLPKVNKAKRGYKF